jgi:hypothetical protein
VINDVSRTVERKRKRKRKERKLIDWQVYVQEREDSVEVDMCKA